jgi:DNA-binding response OmpR family regulator
MRILLAEDDGRLAEPLVAFLERERHSVTWVADGRTALDALIYAKGDARGEHDSYDLALLDWMLPGLDGLSILRELRRRNLTTLVLMITARDGLEDVVAGLAGGADDYLVKPFRMAELAVRIRSLERRADRPYQHSLLRWGPLALDTAAAEVLCLGMPLPLTQRERQLLEWFLRHPGRLISRGQLLEQLWSFDTEAGEDTVKTHLNNLRRKLRAAGSADPIETLHGQGYRLAAAP